jgi:hypothetical protein
MISQQLGQHGDDGAARLGVSSVYMGFSFLPPYFDGGSRTLKRPRV